MKVILATHNKGKISEMQTLLADMGIEVIAMDQAGDIPEIVEDGSTFYENAMKKASTVAKATGLTAIADDSGLEVDALNGQPGVFSARYAGEHASDQENYQKLLKELQNIPSGKRTARFKCVIVTCKPDGRCISAEGVCEGAITEMPRGKQGFGYDPVFIPRGSQKTMAEITKDEKNKISHRGMALRSLKEQLKGFLNDL